MHIIKSDNVKVIAGKTKVKKGKVVATEPKRPSLWKVLT